MATWEDVRRIAGALPEVVETNGSWRVRGKPVAWERPLRRSDYEALGEAAPEGPILGVRTTDVGVKEALISDAPDVFFTTPHFDGYPAVLVDLDAASVEDLEEVILEAWAAQAPKASLQGVPGRARPRLDAPLFRGGSSP